MTDNETSVFLQFKNTDICIDLFCDCGESSHYDGDFARFAKCPHCGQIWELPSMLTPARVTAEHPQFKFASEHHATAEADDEDDGL